MILLPFIPSDKDGEDCYLSDEDEKDEFKISFICGGRLGVISKQKGSENREKNSPVKVIDGILDSCSY